MDVPTWAYDEVLSASSEGALKVALTLYRHGSPQVDSSGRRRAYWRGTKPQLARLARLSKRTIDAAIAELELARLVVLHRTTLPHSGIALSAFVGPEGAKFAPPFQPKTASHDGDREIPSLVGDQLDITTNSNVNAGPEGAKFAPLSDELAAEGVTAPADWIHRFGADRCERALRALDYARQRSEIRNPAGFMRTLLASPRPIPVPPSPQPVDDARRFLGGFEHLANRRGT